MHRINCIDKYGDLYVFLWSQWRRTSSTTPNKSNRRANTTSTVQISKNDILSNVSTYQSLNNYCSGISVPLYDRNNPDFSLDIGG